jgi:hypothetical protein
MAIKFALKERSGQGMNWSQGHLALYMRKSRHPPFEKRVISAPNKRMGLVVVSPLPFEGLGESGI